MHATGGVTFAAVFVILLMALMDMIIYRENFPAALYDLFNHARDKLTLLLLASSWITALVADIRHKRKSDPQEGGRSA
ncbi:hypothetical protein [Cohnella candidum]|uniref:Uncharacterized protein n=1 Tax=Cohnella candidum TaxID=2674991 RepID=A0A3G3JVN5_9BACL|nr:hypothetical protein [Cohnella candidum]AYQ72295.1 hypothetical protein EAV92_06765 [Cohnella candidum]